MCVIEYGKKIANKLKIEIGPITANIASAHIYMKDVKNALKSEELIPSVWDKYSIRAPNCANSFSYLS